MRPIKSYFSVKFALTALNVSGVNPKIQNKFSKIRFSMAMFFVSVILIMGAAEVYAKFEGPESLALAGTLPVYSMCGASILGTFLNRKSLRHLLKEMEYFRSKDNVTHAFNEYSANTNSYSDIIVAYYIAIIGYVSVFFFGPILFLEIPIAFYSFCDTSQPQCFWFIIAVILTNQTFVAPSTFGYDALFIYFIDTIQLELRAFRRTLTAVGQNFENVLKLQKLIKHHNRILDACATLSDVYRKILLYQYMCSTLSICLGVFLMTLNGIPPKTDDMLKYGFWIVSFITQLTIYCWGGTTINEESTAVANAAFETQWWIKTQPKVRRMLVLIILRAQKPAILTLGGVSDVNLSQLLLVLKTSFSFYTLMRNIGTN